MVLQRAQLICLTLCVPIALGWTLLFFRWRTARFGAEMYWYGLLDHDDVPRRRYAEAAQQFKTALLHELFGIGALYGLGVAEKEQGQVPDIIH